MSETAAETQVPTLDELSKIDDLAPGGEQKKPEDEAPPGDESQKETPKESQTETDKKPEDAPAPDPNEALRIAMVDALRLEREEAAAAAEAARVKAAEEEARKKAEPKPEMETLTEEFNANVRQIALIERMLAGDETVTIPYNGQQITLAEMEEIANKQGYSARARYQNHLLKTEMRQDAISQRAKEVREAQARSAERQNTARVLSNAKAIVDEWIAEKPTLKVLKSEMRTVIMDLYTDNPDAFDGKSPQDIKDMVVKKATDAFYESRSLPNPANKAAAPKKDAAAPTQRREAAPAAAPATTAASTGFPAALSAKVAAMAKLLGKEPSELTTSDVSVDDLKNWTP